MNVPEASYGKVFDHGNAAAPGPLEGSGEQAAAVPEGSEGPWTVFRYKRRPRRPAQPVLSSSTRHPKAGQDHVHTTLDAELLSGFSEDSFGTKSEATNQDWGIEFSGLASKEVRRLQPRTTLSVPSGSSPSTQACQPLYFPWSFAEEPVRRRRRVRSKYSCTAPATPAQELWKKSKARLKMWKRLKEVLVHHLCIPEAEEALLISLAECEEVKDNEDGLEGWTAYQLLSKVSENATQGFEILTQAVDDIISHLSSRNSRVLRIRSSNLTKWRPETQKWLQNQSDDVVLVQETHLSTQRVADAVSAMHKVGFEMIGGEAAASARQGTHGGVALMSRSHLKARAVQHFTVEGCGFCAADLRVKGVSLLLLSIYLKNSTPLHCQPNAEILGRLAALLKTHVGQWLMAGDFNVTPHDLASTSLVNELGGQIICAGEPTTHGGSELDFVVTSPAIAGLTSLQLDWSAPHRPHASLCITLVIPGYKDKALRLPSFSVNDSASNCALDKTPPIVDGIHVLGQDFSQDEISRDFAVISKWCQQAMYPGEAQPRGGTLEFRRTTLVPGQPHKPYSTQAGLWLRVESWLNAVAKAGVKVSPKALNGVLEQLEFGEAVGQDACLYRAEILAHLQGVSHLTIENETFITRTHQACSGRSPCG